jgi:hypothetical protein
LLYLGHMIYCPPESVGSGGSWLRARYHGYM